MFWHWTPRSCEVVVKSFQKLLVTFAYKSRGSLLKIRPIFSHFLDYLHIGEILLISNLLCMFIQPFTGETLYHLNFFHYQIIHFSIWTDTCLRNRNHPAAPKAHQFQLQIGYWYQTLKFLSIRPFCRKLLFGPRSILWSHWLLQFWTLCVLPHGFQIQSGYLTCTHSCLCAVILKVTTSVTPAFRSTNRGVHCISMYTAWLARLLSHASGFEPPMQW